MLNKIKECFNNNNNKTKTHPVDKSNCAICLSDNKKLKTYPCDICKPGSWFICQDCIKKCKDIDDKCPVCRTKVIEIIIESPKIDLPKKKKNGLCQDFTYCQIFHFIFTSISYIIGCILIGMIIPTSICYGNCNKQTTICTIFGLLCGIVFTIMIGFFFRSKEEIDEKARFIIAIIGSIIFVLTISINGEFSIITESLLWMIIVCPLCTCFSQKSVVIN